MEKLNYYKTGGWKLRVRPVIRTIRLASYVTASRDGKKRLEWSAATIFLQSNEYREIAQPSGQDLLFSLDGFDYMNPDGLIWLLLLGDQLKTKENSLWLELPRNPEQLRYLKSYNFHNVVLDNFSIVNVYYLNEVSSFMLPESMKFFRVNLMTLTRVMKELNNLFGSVDFLGQLGISPVGETSMEFLPPFLRTIQETTKNIVQHSSRVPDEGAGYFVISPVGKGRVRLCVADAGWGFSASLLSKGIRTKDDFDAIRNALFFRYLRPGGEGLFRVVQFVARLGGVIRMRSGSGEAFLQLPQRLLRSDQDTKHFIEDQLKPVRSRFYFPGVQLQIDLQQT